MVVVSILLVRSLLLLALQGHSEQLHRAVVLRPPRRGGGVRRVQLHQPAGGRGATGAGGQGRVRRRRGARHRGHVVLQEVDDVVVELLHVRQLRQQQRVAPPQLPVVLRQRRQEVPAASTAFIVAAAAGAGVNTVRGGGGLFLEVVVRHRLCRRRGEWVEGVVVVEMVMVMVVGLVRWQRRRRLPPVDLGEEVLGALPEELVGELPPICHYLPKALQQQKQQIKPKKTFSIFFLQ